MKCTLRKVESGVVATIDERPKFNDMYFNEGLPNNVIQRKVHRDIYYRDVDHKIIASTIPNVGKELKFSKHGNILTEGVTTVNFDQQYDYTENETQVIIEL